MFIGEFKHNLDSKKRVIMPAKFREELGDIFIVTRGLDGCLTIYTQEQWSALLEQLLKLPNTDKKSRLYTRSITSKAIECECDSQGRIQLPSYLISEANLVKECVIVGVADHVEIWSKAIWEGYQESGESFEEVAELMTEYLV